MSTDIDATPLIMAAVSWRERLMVTYLMLGALCIMQNSMCKDFLQLFIIVWCLSCF